MAKVYQVNGSEDGTLSIMSSMINAYDRALKYLHTYEFGDITINSKPTDFLLFCEELKENGFVTIEIEGELTAEVTKFYLNE